MQDYKSRFQNVFEISSPNFQVCFLISTCLDVEQNKFLNTKGLIIHKEFIYNYLREKTKNAIKPLNINFTEEFADLEFDNTSEIYYNSEFDEYISCNPSISNIDFWNQNQNKFPSLFELHQKLMSMSPSSCEIESAFSIAALCEGTKKRRNRLTSLNLEIESIVKFNKRLL